MDKELELKDYLKKLAKKDKVELSDETSECLFELVRKELENCTSRESKKLLQEVYLSNLKVLTEAKRKNIVAELVKPSSSSASVSQESENSEKQKTVGETSEKVSVIEISDDSLVVSGAGESVGEHSDESDSISDPEDPEDEEIENEKEQRKKVAELEEEEDSEDDSMKVKDLLDLINSFKGGENYPDFRAQVVASASEVQEGEKAFFIKALVAHKLSQEVRNRIVDCVYQTSEELLKKLDSLYLQGRPLVVIKRELGGVRQRKGEKIEEYCLRVEKLVRELRQEVALETDLTLVKGKLAAVELDAVTAFVQGVWSNNTRLKLELKNPKSYEEAKLLAISCVEVGGSSAMQDRECYKCHKKGHIARDCRVKVEDGETQGKKVYHSNIKCYNCQEMGHISRNCPKKKGHKGDSTEKSKNGTSREETPASQL